MLQTEACSRANWYVAALVAVYVLSVTGCDVSVGLLQLVFGVFTRSQP